MTDSRQMALEALKDSVDLVRAEYEMAVAWYGKYPTRAARIDGLLQLLNAHEDAILALEADLAAKVEPVAWKNTFDDLLEDYVMARVETALWNVAHIQPDGGIRMTRPRLKALVAHLEAAPQQAAAPAGWRLVPCEPTQEMLEVADKGWNDFTLKTFGDFYKAMLAAAPKD